MRWLVVAANMILVLAAACSPPASTLPAAPGVRISVDTTYYDATGLTPREWQASARRNAPTVGVAIPYLANTDWTTHWSYPSTRMRPTGCEAQYPVVSLAIRFRMPRLVGDSVISTEDRFEWLRFIHSLWVHEEGHAARGVRAAAEMQDSIARIHTESCSALSPAIARATRAVVVKYTALQSAYDGRTQHGVRQGAMIIPMRGSRLAVDTTYRDTVP